MEAVQLLGRVVPSGAAVPFYSSSVSAGFPSPADDYAEVCLSLDELTEIRAPSTYLVRTSGESMTGRGIHHDDILIVSRALDPVSGDVVIACYQGEFTVKVLALVPGKRPALLAANPAYPSIYLSEDEELDIFGVVTFNLHRHRK